MGNPLMRKQNSYAWRNKINCKNIILLLWNPSGNETLKKIARHREMRKDKGFDTLERYVDLKGTAEMLTDRPAVLLECMSNLTANEIYRPDGAGEQTADSIVDGVEELCSRCEHVVIVTNEVCSECTRDSADMIRYKKILSEVNRRLAQKADWVTEVVYGIPVEVKR